MSFFSEVLSRILLPYLIDRSDIIQHSTKRINRYVQFRLQHLVSTQDNVSNDGGYCENQTEIIRTLFVIPAVIDIYPIHPSL
jgi:hypothetical protein